jgi:SpoIID/LytB domain protein
VLYGDRPILARYHSTSGGHTLDNSEVFEGSLDLPYLQGVPSTAETASPLFRWEVRFRVGELQTMLRNAGLWNRSHGELRQARTVASRAGMHYPDVMLAGDGGTVVVSAEELRGLLRLQAPSLRPERYPSLASDGVTRLPETLPSNRFEVETSGDTVEVLGRGWGHGVGMSQWGAQGMARNGASHEQILAHYYPGTSLDKVPAGEPVEVGVAWARDESPAFGAFRIIDGLGNTVVGRAFGTWAFTWDGPGAVAVRAPRGFGRTPKVTLERAPARVRAGDTAALRVRLSAPSRVTTSTTGRRFDRSTEVVRNGGPGRVDWRAPMRPGSYRVVVRAATGSATDVSRTHEIHVVAAPDPARPPGAGAGWGVTLVQGVAAAVLIAVVAVGVASFAGTMRR